MYTYVIRMCKQIAVVISRWLEKKNCKNLPSLIFQYLLFLEKKLRNQWIIKNVGIYNYIITDENGGGTGGLLLLQ